MRLTKRSRSVLLAFALAVACGFLTPLCVIALQRWGEVRLPQSPLTLWLPPYVLASVVALWWWRGREPVLPFAIPLELLGFLLGPLLGIIMSIPFGCTLARDCF